MAQLRSPFDRAFDAVVIGEEGGFTQSYWDPGNWTGGMVGRGECRGTDMGLSAASFPTLRFPVTVAVARAIYRARYWNAISGDALPPALGLLLFDCAVNQGAGFAARAVQAAVHVSQDGVIGPETLAAIGNRPLTRTLCGVFVTRALEYARGDARFQRGWFARLYRISAAAAVLSGETG